DSYRIGLEWDDDRGQSYYETLEQLIYKHGILPEPNQRLTDIEALQLTLRFPVRGWRRLIKGKRAVVSMIVPDPAGESFHQMDQTITLSYLVQSSAVVLMVDPWMSETYRANRRRWGNEVTEAEAPGAATALTHFTKAVRGLADGRGALDQQLAV